MNLKKILLVSFGFFLSIEQGFTVVLGVLSNGVARGADVLMPVDLAMYGLLILTSGRRTPQKHRGIHGFALAMAALYLLWSGVGEFVAVEKADFRFGYVHLARAILVFFVILKRINSKKDVIDFTRGLIYGLGFEALIGVWQWQIGPVVLPFIVVTNEWRATGTIGVANAFGCYLAMLAPISIRLALFTKIKPKWLWSAISVMSLGALLATYTRGAWLSLSVALMFFFYLDFLMKKLSRRQINYLLVAFVIGLAFTTLKYGETITGRMADSREAIASNKKHSRMGLAKDAVRIIRQHPLTGIALNNYRYHADKEIQGTRIVHNVYLLIMAQQGVPGIILFLLLNLSVFIVGFKIRKSQDPTLYHIGMGGLAGMLSNFIYYLVAPDYRLVILKLHHWRALAMIVAILIADEHTKKLKQQFMLHIRRQKEKKARALHTSQTTMNETVI
ncbi:O-antigen ligase domain-containing protein [candidate division KSB1 bacterium]|nr:O-antigen ligase family protein [candidate division KSB1 bacterium]RQW06288.1 MAG: O-antigen ligase domain-containing protein [candidate division KSB1 bacterium]